MMSMPIDVSMFMQQIFDSAGLELLMFFLAFGLHFLLFGKHGVLRHGKKKAPSVKIVHQSLKQGDLLARSLQSLMQMPGVYIELPLKGSESFAEVEELLAAAAPNIDQEIVRSAVAKQRKDVLKHFLHSHPQGGTGLTKRLVQSGLLAEALQCAKVTRSSKIYPVLFNVIMETLCEQKQVKTMGQVLAHAQEDYSADVHTYNWMIKALLHAGKTMQAMRVIEDMKRDGMRPNSASFTQFLDAHKGDLEKTMAIVKAMQACNIDINSFVCSMVIKSINKGTKETQAEKALELIKSQEVCEKDSGLLASLCEACARSGHYRLLIGHLESMKHVAYRCSHTVGTIIRAYGMVEDLQGVWGTWQEMKKRNIEPTRITIGCMVEALASNDDPEGAHGIIREALANPECKSLVNAVMYNSVLKSFSHQNNFDRVWTIHDEMLREKLELTVATYNALLDACARSNEISRAEPLFKEMLESGMKPNIITYGTVIKAYCASDCLDQAFAVMEELKNTNVEADEIIYNTLLDGCARYGHFERGMELLQSMRKAGPPPSNYTLSVAAKLATRSRKPEKAFQIVDELAKEFDLRPNVHVYNNLLQAAAHMGDLEKAQELFATMLTEKVRPSGRTYFLLLRLCCNQKAAGTATALLRAALGLPQEKDRASHPWKKDMSASLLALAFRRMQSDSWAAVPRRGKDALSIDVLTETCDFLARHEKPGGSEEFAEVFKEVQKAFPAVKLATRTGQRSTKPK